MVILLGKLAGNLAWTPLPGNTCLKTCSGNLVPHIFVWGSCFWFCIPPPSPPPPPAASRHHTYNLSSRNSHTTQLTHNLLTYKSTHTTCSHTTQLTHNLLTYHTIQLVIIQLAHTHNSTHTHNLLTHTTCHHTTCSHTQLNSHTTCSHALTHTCSHTTCLTHITYITHTHTHTRVITQLVHTQLVHTQLPHTQLVHAQLAHTQLVLPDIHLRDRRGTWRHPPSFHVAGVALTALGGLWWRTGFSADAVDAAAL